MIEFDDHDRLDKYQLGGVKMPEIKENQYAERDCEAQGAYYMNHIMAMTTEKLHSKSDIAAELAHRDIEIDRLKNVVEECKKIALDGLIFSPREEIIIDGMIQDVQMYVVDPIQQESIALLTKLKALVSK